MAIAAIDSIISDVMLMAELYRLRSRNVLIRRIGRTRQSQNAGKRQPNQKNGREQTKSRNEIRAAMKNLGHVCVALLRRPLPEGAEAWRLRGVMAGKCVPGAYLNDRIVSDKTLWKATFSRSLFKKIFDEFRSRNEAKLSNCLKRPQLHGL
jgi:hypothetical protein